MNEVASAYREHGSAGVRTYLEQNPRALSVLAGQSRSRVETMLDRAGAGSVAAEEIQSAVSAKVHQLVSREVRRAVSGKVTELQQLRREVTENIESFRNAPADSEKGQIAEALGIRGDAGDVERAQGGLDNLMQAYEGVATRITGQTWQVADFEDTARRLASENGLGTGIAGTFTGAALERDLSGEIIHAGVQSVEGTHMVVEALAHGLGAALPLAIGGLGLGVGIAIHGEVARRHEVFVGLANSLGIR